MLGVNTNINLQQRNDILAQAKSLISQKIQGQDCANFLAQMIKGLGVKLSGSIKTAGDFITSAIGVAQYDAYAAVNLTDAQGRVSLNMYGFAYAKTIGNKIYLGENFFDPTLENSYNHFGGDSTATLLHEFFHLQGISASGKDLEESDLDAAAGGNFGKSMRDNCGPK